jgi:hypothetical protein
VIDDLRWSSTITEAMASNAPTDDIAGKLDRLAVLTPGKARPIPSKLRFVVHTRTPPVRDTRLAL